MSATILSPRSNLLEETESDNYFNSKSSYYKRGNLLATSSFRQKYKNGFRRSRSSSYTSLDDEKEQQNDSLLEQTPAVITPPPVTTSFFSRRKKMAHRSNTAPTATALNAGPDTQDGDYFNHEDNYVDAVYNNDEDEDSDENTFFAKQNYYSRQNLSKPPTSWKSSVLKAVGVKSR